MRPDLWAGLVKVMSWPSILACPWCVRCPVMRSSDVSPLFGWSLWLLLARKGAFESLLCLCPYYRAKMAVPCPCHGWCWVLPEDATF
ncbi:hypothetical protein F5Y08DRAFT_228694 [Xylaria arbuscula]|nr:hypothetical protein F5Y08DRAFT_228694 [Xylaria arbuscula]